MKKGFTIVELSIALNSLKISQSRFKSGLFGHKFFKNGLKNLRRSAYPSYYKSAFTLVELSIVLVIIGLLTAGVVGGQSLIDSAKRQRLITEFTGYEKAVMAFKLEYDGLPGDLKDAESYWGTKSSCLTDTTKTNTCNGNGDGQIDYNATNTSYEYMMAFNQLALAGIIPGQYHGVRTSATDYAIIGDNVPASSAYQKVAFYLLSPSQPLTATAYYGVMDRTAVMAGGEGLNGADLSYLNGGFLTPKEANSIDKKIDDGLASRGRVFGHQQIGGTVGYCVTGGSTITTVTTADYILTTTDKACRILYWLD